MNNSVAQLFSAFWSGATLALMALTWPLWFVDSSPGSLPTITLFPGGLVTPELSTGVLNASAGLLVISLVVNLVGSLVHWRARVHWQSRNHPKALHDDWKRWGRVAWTVIAISLTTRFLFDNLSLQAWAYQTWLFGWILAFSPRQSLGRWLRLIAISIYFYSALGKFDFQFAHTVGSKMLDTVLSAGQLTPDSFSAEWKARLALAFPSVELLIALGLAWKRTRKIAAILAVAMHASLIMLLGPWGLNHSEGVLMWNAALIAQAWILFWGHDRWSIHSETKRSALPGWMFVASILVLLLLAPLSERRGVWDHWTSWSLYSPHTGRVTVEIHRSAIGKLPQALHGFVQPDHDDDGWRVLSIAQWSLETKRVPVYPQARYQLAIADRIAERYDLRESIRAIERTPSDRFNGTRNEFRMLNAREIREHTRAFWLSRPVLMYERCGSTGGVLRGI